MISYIKIQEYFHFLVKHRIDLLMHKLSNDNVPKSFQNVDQCNQNVHSHYTRQASHVHSMWGNNEFVYGTFVFQSVLYGIKLFIILRCHMLILSIYLRISYYLIIFPFDMTNKTPHHSNFVLYQYRMSPSLMIYFAFVL